MSISQVSSAGAASSYYQGDNYYAKDGEGVWFGKGAENFKLAGLSVEPNSFKNIMTGELPNGQTLYRIVDGEKKHIAGYDITFSAPKGVSAMALVIGDDRYSIAHNEAVQSTLETIETDFLKTRKYNKVTTKQEEVGGQGMLAAIFTHDISRNEDPQLHTHCVIANAALDEDGKYRSVHSYELFKNKMLIGEIYRSNLQANLIEKSLGRLEQTHIDGRFDLKDVPSSVINEFSTRSKDIAEYLGEGAHTAEDKANAALKTRRGKKKTSRQTLRGDWDKRLQALGLTKSALSKSVSGRPQFRHILSGSITPRSALENALQHVGETSSTFESKDVLRFMLAEGAGGFRYPKAKDELALAIDEGSLHQSKDKALLYTQETLDREKITLALEKTGRASVKPILPRKMVQTSFEGNTLTKGQLRASKLILTSPNQTIGVQGYAGTGKTFMLASAARQAQEAGYTVLGLAPTSNATKTLGEDAQIKSQTLQSYLKSASGNHKTILFVDEASLISTHQMLNLLSLAKERNLAKVVLVGDTKQLNGVAAGTPFKMLQSQDMRFAVMDEIKRQKQERHLQAVKDASVGDINRAFKKLGNDILEVPLKDLSKETAATWIKSGDRENAAIVVTTNKMADAVNTHVKAALIEEGSVSDVGHKIITLKPLRLSEQQKGYANNYRQADMIRFNRSYSRLNIMAGDTLPITGIGDDGVISLLKNGKGVEFKPSRDARAEGAVEAFRSEDMQINEGDKVRWTRPDYANDIKNMDTGTISKIDDTHVTLKMTDGASVSYNKDHIQLSFLKHAWAQTGHAYQGQTINHVVVAMPSISGLTTQKSFYVDISRARHEISFLTDNVDRLRETLNARTGEERSALDLVAEKERHQGFDQRSNEVKAPQEEQEQHLDRSMSISR